MIKRAISTVALWALIVLALYYGGADAGVFLLTIVAVASQNELYRLLQKAGHRPFRNFGTCLGAVMMLAPYYTLKLYPSGEKVGLEGGIIAVTLVVCCLRIMRERDGTNRMETLAFTLFGLVYIPFMLQFLVRVLTLTADSSQGLLLAIWITAVAKFCDVGALLVGTAVGRHPMSPTMSPKKTWEGAVGGVILSMGVGAGLAVLLHGWVPTHFTPLAAALIAMPVATVSIVSDLIESVIKRRANVKDSGRFIPGIGGAFDLSDSLILAAPVGYLLLRIIL